MGTFALVYGRLWAHLPSSIVEVLLLRNRYEPELFPGLVFRTIDPKVVFLVFRSGKIVSTGAKNLEVIKKVFKAFYHGILKHYTDATSADGNSATYRKKYKNGLENAETYI
mgnify:CR=1 FL=1